MGARLDFCTSKQKKSQIIAPIIVHYPPRWGGLNPFDRMLDKKIKMSATKASGCFVRVQ